MLHRIVERLSYANVVSTLCLFLILGGGAWAAVNLPSDSVGTRQLKDDAVRGSKVAAGSIRASDIGGAVDKAREASHAADADAIGGNSADDFLPRSAVRSFNEGTGCGLVCSDFHLVTSAAGWDIKADCTLYNDIATYTLHTVRQTPEGGGHVDYLLFTEDEHGLRGGSTESNLPTVEATPGHPANGFGTLFITGEGLYATVNFQYSLTVTGDEMDCRTYGVVVQPPAPL